MKKSLRWILLAWAVASATASAAQLPFINDDFPKAQAQATERKLPIFVECWAPW